MNKLLVTVILSSLLFSSLCFADVENDDPNLKDCGEWINCNPNPPDFNGTCCRICYFIDLGYREWDCAIHTNDIGFDDETKQKIKKRFLYNSTNPNLRELLIVELDKERN